MQAHSKDASLVGRCCGVLFIYGLAYKTPDVALEAGCIHEIMNAMGKFEDDQLLQTSGCKALWNLTRTEDTVRVISKEMGGLKAILKAMKLFQGNGWPQSNPEGYEASSRVSHLAGECNGKSLESSTYQRKSS